MNEPNTQSDRESQQPQRMSSRATNFLIMGSKNNQTGSVQEAQNENTPSETSNTQTAAHTDEGTPEATSAPKQTGVISSRIYPAERPANTQQAPSPPSNQMAARTNQLTPPSAETSKTKPQNKEERIERLAERITDVLKKISDIKTGMLNPDYRASQKIQLMAERSPGLSKFLAVMLTQLEPLLLLVQRINQKLVEKNLVKNPPPPPENPGEQAEEDQGTAPPPEKISFIELAEKNIIFCDNRKRPLYSLEQMRGKHGGYTASEAVLAPMIIEEIIKAFHEVAPKAKAIPTPTSGIYAHIPMNEVMDNITDEEIMRFLNYVQRFPRGYVGKNFRITESFAGWVVSGTPDD